MNKIFAILIVIGLAFMIGCVGGESEVMKISDLNKNLAEKKVVLEGTISYEHSGQIPFNGCYLTDETGEIKLSGDKILVKEFYPQQCQYENKKVRITGVYNYNPSVIKISEEIEKRCDGCQSTITVEKIEEIEQKCTDESIPIEFTTIEKDIMKDSWDAEKPFDGKEEFIINTQEEWSEFYLELIGQECGEIGAECGLVYLPEINFENETVIAVINKNIGYKNSLTIGDISISCGKVKVYVTATGGCFSPVEGAPVGGSYNPYHIVKTRKIEKAEFETAYATPMCVPDCPEGDVWDGAKCICDDTQCPIPEIEVPNGYIDAYCDENGECTTRTICDTGFEWNGTNCEEGYPVCISCGD